MVEREEGTVEGLSGCEEESGAGVVAEEGGCSGGSAVGVELEG